MGILAQPRLLVVSGPLRGMTFDCGQDEMSVGRRDTAIAIDHKSVSRRHCVFTRVGTSLKVRDLGSRNGTIVNGERVEERLLNHGDRIMVGNTNFIFLIEDEDVASLLSEVQVIEGTFDPATSIELQPDQTLYLRPEDALSGAADTRVLQNFSALLRLGATLQTSQRLAALEEQALKLIMEAIPAETGAILLTGRRLDHFDSVFGRKQDGSQSVTVSRSVVKHVLEAGTGLLTNNATGEMPHIQSLIEAEARSVLCVPLLSGQRRIGAIYLASGEDHPPFDESHLQLLTAMAAILTLPLDSAHRLDWLENENLRLQNDIGEEYRLIGDGHAMKQVYRFISRVASTDSTVLIRGESGTGKELIARALHRSSGRAKAPFIVINCAALSGELLESELFGHEKGAFTSAIAQKKGKFELADGGTVFLDEVAELAPALQVKLLRVLQEREFERVGGSRPIKVDVRVLAATDRDLEEAIRQGQFRHELYYRLNVLSLESPSLRRRPEDIAALANYFAARYAARYNSRIRGISAEAKACLLQYDWPGNVRELQNAIERAVVLGGSDTIVPEDLPDSVIEARRPAAPHMRFHEGVREAKLQLIQNALDQAAGNHAEAARILGVNRTYLHRLIRNLDLGKD
jgi:transcriptional regulator with GAF, ATPase, and Fis domain